MSVRPFAFRTTIHSAEVSTRLPQSKSSSFNALQTAINFPHFDDDNKAWPPRKYYVCKYEISMATKENTQHDTFGVFYEFWRVIFPLKGNNGSDKQKYNLEMLSCIIVNYILLQVCFPDRSNIEKIVHKIQGRYSCEVSYEIRWTKSSSFPIPFQAFD